MMVMVAERERWRRGVTHLPFVTARRHPRSGHRKKFSDSFPARIYVLPDVRIYDDPL
jgi:hypothetical protein